MLAAQTQSAATRLHRCGTLRRCGVIHASAAISRSCASGSDAQKMHFRPVMQTTMPLQWHTSSHGSRTISSTSGYPKQMLRRKDQSTQQRETTQPETTAAITKNITPQATRRKPEQKFTQISEPNRRTGKKMVKPNQWTLVSAVALEKETVRIMQQCRQKQEGSVGTIKQNCFDVMEAWILHAQKEQDIKSAHRAASILKTVEEQLKIIPRLQYYEAVIRAYASCSNDNDGSKEAAKQADCIVHHVAKYTPHTLTGGAYHNVITAWANSGSREAGERAATLRQAMKSSTGDHSDIVQAEMKAWTRSGHPKAPERILQLLLKAIQDWTESQHQSSHSTGTILVPSEAMFHTAMGVLAKSATQHKQRALRQVAHQLDDIAKLMIDRQHDWQITPSLRTFMIVLGAWERVERVEKQGDAAQRAESLLEYMIQSATDQKKQQSSLLNTTQPVRIMPTNTSFMSVMVAWCDAEHPERAAQLYQRLVELHKSTKDPKLLPTTYVANTLLSGWAKLGRPDRVLEVMTMMQRVAIDTKHPACQLDLRTFNILLNALGKASHPNDSLSLLDWLENHDHKIGTNPQIGKLDKFAAFFNPATITGLQQPNDISYSCVLEVLGKNSMMRNAETILEHMKQIGIQPSQIAYTCVIHGYSLTGHDPNNVTRAHKIFQEVTATQKPDVVCCTSFLNVCSGALPLERDLALDLALEVYEMLGPHERNDKMYKAMASVIKRLVVWHKDDTAGSSITWSTPEGAASEQKRMIQRLTQDCCGSGCLSGTVLSIVEQVVGRGEVAATMGRDHLHPSWSSNVRPFNQPKEVIY